MDLLREDLLRPWTDGGWVMVPLFLLAVVIYSTAARLLLELRSYHRNTPPELIDAWIRQPERGEGKIGDIIRYTREAGSPAEIQNRFSEVISAHLPKVDGRLVFLEVLVATAPLLGLMGTVLGMLDTFQGLSATAGKTLELIASGISEALITTKTGLLIALPGYFLAQLIRRKRNDHDSFFRRLESLTLQEMKRKPIEL